MMEFFEAFIYASGKVETTDLMDQIFETLDQQLSFDSTSIDNSSI